MSPKDWRADEVNDGLDTETVETATIQVMPGRYYVKSVSINGADGVLWEIPIGHVMSRNDSITINFGGGERSTV